MIGKLKEKGITLVALVVTIIIILILAGVTISQITGENGLITRTRQAADKYKEKEQEEQEQLSKLEQLAINLSKIGGEGTSATEDQVLMGASYLTEDGTKHIGIMNNFAGLQKSGVIKKDGSNAMINIPDNGYYTKDSIINIENIFMIPNFESNLSKFEISDGDRMSKEKVSVNTTIDEDTACAIFFANSFMSRRYR